jgi:hypothetical protein
MHSGTRGTRSGTLVHVARHPGGRYVPSVQSGSFKMIKPSHVTLWRRCSCAALLLACAVAAAMAPLHAQDAAPRVGSSNPAVATDGATLIHGNYCGAGNRPGTPPIDALDLACMNHDACTPASGIPNCDCNARLRDEAAAVAQDPRQAPELRSLASLTAAAATVMICKPSMLNAAAPPAAVAPAPVAGAPVSIVPAAAAPASAEPATEAPAPVAPTQATITPLADAPASEAPVSAAPASAAPASAAPASAAPVSKSRSLP